METLGSNFEYHQIPSNCQILGIANIELISFHNTVKYPQQPSATVGNHMGTHQIPLATLNIKFIFFLNVFSDGHEAATKDGDHRPSFYSRASIVFIQTNPDKIQIYRQLLLATQIPSNTQVFLWYLGCEYCQIPPNTLESTHRELSFEWLGFAGRFRI